MAMDDEIVKICKKHGVLDIKNIIVNKKKYLNCRLCKKESDNQYYCNNKNKWTEYFKKNREKIRINTRKSQEKYRNKEDVKIKAKERYALVKNDRSFIEKRKNYRDGRKEKKKISDKAYRDKNKEMLSISKKQYLESLPPKVRGERKKRKAKLARELLQKNIKNLSDGYVKGHIAKGTSLTYKDVPMELVELKRVQIMLRRELRKQKEVMNVNKNS